MRIINSIGTYLWNVLKSIGAVFWAIVNQLPRRVLLIIIHIVRGPIYFSIGLFNGIKLLFKQPGQWTGWFGSGLISILAWTGRVLSKTIDVLLIGELLDLVFQIVKPNSRTLTKLELDEARKVFEKGIPYWQVRIDEASLLAWLGAKFAGSTNMGVTTFHTINFTRKLKVAPGNRDMEWLIHELAHISQMEHVGTQYIVEALVAQNKGGYQYGGHTVLTGKKLRDFNREQQAEIAADFYSDVLYGSISSDFFMSLIEEFRGPKKGISFRREA